jgi:hypothetical protein
MTGEEFISLLVGELKIKLGAATKSQWRKRSNISSVLLRNAFRQFEKQKFDESISPLTEFHELSFKHGKNADSFASRINNKAVESKLKEKDSIGVYAFFDASGRAIYIGKTEKTTLFKEMEQRYWHKPMSVRLIRNGKSCPLGAKINDVAKYFSAYKTEKYLIKNVEALLTRVIINSASNIRVEGFHKPT